jgi:Ca-activated chloride channel family protein
MRNARLLVCVAAVLAVVSLCPVAPEADRSRRSVGAKAEQRPTFRAGTDVVDVYVSVTYQTGTFAPNLSAADFTVRDNGDVQKIEWFDTPSQSITAAVLVDRSPSLFGSVPRLQDAVTAFARKLQPRDRATLGFFSHVVTLKPELTGDADVLIKRLGDDAPFPAGTAVWDAIDAGREALSKESGRRVILVLTDASDNCSRQELAAVRSRLERDGAMLFAVGVRGKEGLRTAELEGIAKASGGRYIELKPTDNANAALESIADELHQQYVLGFRAKNLDNKVHRLSVTTPRAGLVIRARRSYFAASANVR